MTSGAHSVHPHPSMCKRHSVGAKGVISSKTFDQPTGYSNFGPGLDLVAPGGNGGLPGGFTADFIMSACSQFAFGGACAGGTTYLFANGTSTAAPHVAGAGAVVESNVGSMPTGQLEQCLLTTAKPLLPTWKYGKGRLDVRKASLCTGSRRPWVCGLMGTRAVVGGAATGARGGWQAAAD